MKRFLALLFFTVTAAACTHNGPVPTSLDGGNAGDTPCASYCQLSQRLGCTWAQPTAAGADCITVCRDANTAAGPIQWSFTCRLAATSCAGIATCQ